MLTGGGDQSSRGGSPRQSVSVGSTVPPAISASSAAQRSSAATEMAGSTRAFVASARLAGQVQAPLGARHRGGIPDRGLQQHVGGGVAHLGGARAHHAADRGGGDVVDDEHVGGVEAALDVVEGDDRLPRLGEPHPEAAGDQAAIVGVHRVAESRASRSWSRRRPVRWPGCRSAAAGAASTTATPRSGRCR